MKPFVMILLALMLAASSASAVIQGSSTASNCGEGGNWIDITFTTNEGVTLVDAWWDWNATNVWLDADGTSMCSPQNDGVTSYSFYFDVPAGTDTQDFGSTFTGFDGGDYFRFTMDLDMGATGMPYGSDLMGGTIIVEFSDATVLSATFDTPYDGTNGATANFSNLPNFEFDVKPGWAGSLVPRSVDDASWTNVPAPTFLIGEADSTWLNACYRNTGPVTAGASRMDLYLDGDFLDSRSLWTIPPYDWNGSYNFGPYQVPGGRHVLRVRADALNAVAESDETDNVTAVQMCWQGDYLPPLTTWTRPVPPLNDQDYLYGPFPWHHCDGVRIQPSASYEWVAVWGERLSDDGLNNYMLRLHPASDDPEAAFGFNVAATSYDSDLHALLVNTHTMGHVPWDVGIINFWSALTEDYRIAHLHESPYPFDFGIEPSTPYTVQRLAMFQFHVGPGDLGPATLTLYSDPEDGPVHMGWLLPDFENGDLADLLDPVATDAEGLARIDMNLAVTGEYCCVVYGNRVEHPSSLAVNVGLYKARPDLEPTTYTGWHAPIVPQPHDTSALFNCPLPDTLHGGQPLTWLNYGARNAGLASADTVSWGLDIDGMGDMGLRQFSSLAAGSSRNVRNLDRAGTPWTIPGGRHTLTLNMDYLDDLDESVERNNDSARQYCWSPPTLPTNASVNVTGFERLPDREGGWDACDGGETLYWNCDGWRVPYIPPIGGNRWWTGAAVMPPSTFVNTDLQLHTALSGTQDGFGPSVLAESFAGDGQIDFVLVNDRLADNVPHDVGVLDDVDQFLTSYDLQEVRSTWGGIAGPGEMGPYAMGAGRMLNLHEFLLDPGPHLITLKDNGTGVDWGMSFYQGAEYFGKDDALEGEITWLEPDGVTERMIVNVPVSGSACLAVWKTDAGELAKEGSYSLWVAEGVSGVEEEVPAIEATRIVAASPNPFNPTTTISFEMEQDGPCHLALYDLQGRLVRTLVMEDRRAGPGEAVWDGLDAQGSRAASGVYLARLRAAGVADLMKVTLVK
ncbi:MAG: hypothetical protein GY838_16995 [bacterium]|nr:hypothetical protein [bacterium]